MNKQELIEAIKNEPYEKGIFVDTIKFNRNWLLRKIEKLDEPKKIEIPQFVADWYEENNDDFETSLFQCIYEILKKRNDNELNEFEKWVIDENTEPFKTLVNMHQFGYEVEKEKRYLVKMKGIDTNFNFLNRHRNENYWIFSSKDKNTLYQTRHTRKELEEAGFGWVFDCEGVEVQEVE